MPKKTTKTPSKKTTKKAPPKKKQIAKSQKKIIASADRLPIPYPKELIKQFQGTLRGRPTKYTSSMSQRAIEIMAAGRSKEDCATLLGITTMCLWQWTNEFNEDQEGNKTPNPNYKEEFFYAIKIGEALSALWWREVGRINIYNKDFFNNTLYMMQMQNRFQWTRAWDANIKCDVTKTEKKVFEFKIGDQKTEYVAELLQVLIDSGGITDRLAGESSPAESH